TDGFQTASIPIPADLIGKVGTFSIIARDTGAVTFPDVLVDDFRLVSDDIVITDDSGSPNDGIVFFGTSDGRADPSEPGSDPNFVDLVGETIPDGAPIGDVDDPGFRVEV